MLLAYNVLFRLKEVFGLIILNNKPINPLRPFLKVISFQRGWGAFSVSMGPN